MVPLPFIINHVKTLPIVAPEASICSTEPSVSDWALSNPYRYWYLEYAVPLKCSHPGTDLL